MAIFIRPAPKKKGSKKSQGPSSSTVAEENNELDTEQLSKLVEEQLLAARQAIAENDSHVQDVAKVSTTTTEIGNVLDRDRSSFLKVISHCVSNYVL